MTIVGVDISTFAVHTAWIEDGQPRRWHIELGTSKDDPIDRLRRIQMQWPDDVSEIVVEYPYGPNREVHGKLMAVAGAVTKSAPAYCRVAWISSQDLRKAIGAANNKPSAHQALVRLLDDHKRDWFRWSADDLDALVACIGWTRILAA